MQGDTSILFSVTVLHLASYTDACTRSPSFRTPVISLEVGISYFYSVDANEVATVWSTAM